MAYKGIKKAIKISVGMGLLIVFCSAAFSRDVQAQLTGQTPYQGSDTNNIVDVAPTGDKPAAGAPVSNPPAGNPASVQTLRSSVPSTNIYDKYFRLTVCDGPKIPAKFEAELIPTIEKDFIDKFGHPPPYAPCDFNYAMIQAQHLINLAIIGGVLLAIVLFSYAGYLFVKGTPASITQGKEIFRRVFWGFVIILLAWFVVFQILDWLTGKSGFSALLGKPL